MLLDFLRSGDKTAFDADVCIVGSGAAGLTVAAHLGGGLRVLIVEAGGRRPGLEGLAGEAADWAFTGFEQGRARSFGGATRLWAGQCIRLDPIDFERRDWVPHSGWPIAASDLAPFYDRAEAFLGVPGAVYDASTWHRAGIGVPCFQGADVTPKFTVYMPQPDFTKQFGRRLAQERRVDILLNAAVTSVDLAEDGRQVEGLTLQGDGGRKGRVRARAFVLCGGGIDNPRMLLASSAVAADGVGNGRGLVGRFFQDHPSGTTGVIATDRPAPVQNQFRMLRKGGIRYWPKLALTEAAQRRGRTLNANALMLYDYDDRSALTQAKATVAAAKARAPMRLAAEGARLLRHVPELAGRAVHMAATGKAPTFKPRRVMLKAHVEQRPDPENRVTLANERDRFGVPLPRLAWRVHPDELRTLRTVTEAVGQVFQRQGWGEMTVAPWLDEGAEAARPYLEDTYHHHGTTRMATTPAEGVTDPHCQVFGTENLYIAGSSVFPTSGYANPTLTIVALAIRLGDTLRQRLAA